MADITYADKDKNIKDGVHNKFTDLNANEIKTKVNSKEDKSTKGNPNGYCPLDAGGQIPAAFLVGGNPFVGNYNADSALFPASGGSGPGGVVLKGNVFDIVLTDPTTPVIMGGQQVNHGGTIRALTDNPLQDSTKWKISNV
jgi:hypothetical protein